MVQHQVREILAHQLRNENIRYFQVISVTAPIFWRGLDITATIASDARRLGNTWEYFFEVDFVGGGTRIPAKQLKQYDFAVGFFKFRKTRTGSRPFFLFLGLGFPYNPLKTK